MINVLTLNYDKSKLVNVTEKRNITLYCTEICRMPLLAVPTEYAKPRRKGVSLLVIKYVPDH